VAIAYLGLGGNLGNVRETFDRAIEALERSGVRVLRRSPLYRTAPIGPPGQADYTNAAIEIETALEPEPLLDRLKQIESDLGRTTGERWGPRVIDLDVLLFGDRVVDTPRLVVPHRELKKRRFALAPLADLAPGLVIPGEDRTVRAILDDLEDDPGSVVRISSP
jgi:2-amino-4-hydroxy-6-hydroxymethyldihydropteridine diphosphokinase